jgi:hypothetical protein
MKIILRDSLTGLYYGGNQTWCAEASGAMDFASIQTAASVAQEQKLETVKVVLRDEEPTCELVLPLGLYRALNPVRME